MQHTSRGGLGDVRNVTSSQQPSGARTPPVLRRNRVRLPGSGYLKGTRPGGCLGDHGHAGVDGCSPNRARPHTASSSNAEVPSSSVAGVRLASVASRIRAGSGGRSRTLVSSSSGRIAAGSPSRAYSASTRGSRYGTEGQRFESSRARSRKPSTPGLSSCRGRPLESRDP
jgi:hypothetical protein